MVSNFFNLIIKSLKSTKYLKSQECPPHVWKSETLENTDTKDSVTYLYCEVCNELAGSGGKRETFNNIE